MRAILILLAIASTAAAQQREMYIYQTEPFVPVGEGIDCPEFPPLTMTFIGEEISGQVGGGVLLSPVDGIQWNYQGDSSSGVVNGELQVVANVNIIDENLPVFVPGKMSLLPTGAFFSAAYPNCSVRAREVPFVFAQKTIAGDSSGDSVFDSGDLVQVMVAGKYETGEFAGWIDGDWALDGVFDTNDFVFALTFGNYEQAAPVVAVPEPTSGFLAAISLLILSPLRRYSRAGRQLQDQP